MPEEETALGPEERTLRSMRTGGILDAWPQSRSPRSSGMGHGDNTGPLQTCPGAGHELVS